MSQAVSEEMLNVWLNQLCSQPRSSSSFAAKGSSNSVINVLQQTMQRYLSDVKVTHMTADKRDPEFRFYDQTKSVMTAYSVKPAIFDLFLTGAIAAYIAVVYFGVQVTMNDNFSLVFVERLIWFYFSLFPAISLSVRPCDQGLQEQNAMSGKA